MDHNPTPTLCEDHKNFTAGFSEARITLPVYVAAYMVKYDLFFSQVYPIDELFQFEVFLYGERRLMNWASTI